MNTKFCLAAAMLAACLHATTASADIVIGVKVGAVDYDVSGSDPGINASAQLAFDIFDIGIADIALEGEVSTSLKDGTVNNDDISFESAGLYAALRTAGPVYAIVRVGYVESEIELENGSSIDDGGVSTGVGIGFSAGIRMEIEYTQYEIENVDISYLTLGFAF